MKRSSFADILSDMDRKTDRKAAAKFPSLAGIRIPTGLALEQCSSEAAALHKAYFALRLISVKCLQARAAVCETNVEPRRHPLEQSESGIAPGGGCEATGDKQRSTCKVCDLTGGLGIDCWAFSRVFEKVLHNEMNPVLSAAAQENFQSLEIGNVEFSGFEINADRSDWKSHIESFGPDIIYLDPARRSASGKKVFLLEDCSPNVLELLPTLLSVSPLVLLKLSPMADISLIAARIRERCIAATGLNCLKMIQAVGLEGECKELLCVIDRDWTGGYTVSAVILATDGGTDAECSTLPDRAKKIACRIAEADEITEGKTLLCPGAVILKTGMQDIICENGPAAKLDRFTQLFICDGSVPNELRAFFSRYRITELHPFCKESFKLLGAKYPQADVTAKNLPLSSEELRARIVGTGKFPGSGKYHIWGFSSPHGRFLAVCERIHDNQVK